MKSEIMLSEICEIVMGQSPLGETCNLIGNGTPLLNGPTEFSNTHPKPVQYTIAPKKISKRGDLLFCVRGSTTGKMNWADKEYAIGRGLAAIRGINGYPNIYIRSIIEVNLQSLLSQATGSTFPNVSKEMIENIVIPDTPLSVAKSISALLQPIDDRITLLRETNTTLEAIAQALFKSWFIDFDPVHAKMQGQAPQGMDEATAALFPDSFEESELGPVPKGWAATLVSEVSEIVKGKSYSSKDLENAHTTALVTLKSFERGGGFRMDGFKPYSGNYKPSQIVTAGDLIIAYTDVTQNAELIGKPAIVITVEEYETLVASLDVGIIRPNTLMCGRQFLYGLFKTDKFQNHTLAHTSGTTVLHLSKDGVGSFTFALPPHRLIEEFEQITGKISERIQTNINQIRSLSSSRDTLLPRLISGQLEISEVKLS